MSTAGRQRGSADRSGGFTLIELLVVVVIVAIASAAVSLSLRDPAATQLEREAERLNGLFETARAESRAIGVPVQWVPGVDENGRPQFRFVGLPDSARMPTRWLGDAGVAVEIVGARSVRLGPEPMVGAQRLVLSLGAQQLVLGTDGFAPFHVLDTAP